MEVDVFTALLLIAVPPHRHQPPPQHAIFTTTHLWLADCLDSFIGLLSQHLNIVTEHSTSAGIILCLPLHHRQSSVSPALEASCHDIRQGLAQAGECAGQVPGLVTAIAVHDDQLGQSTLALRGKNSGVGKCECLGWHGARVYGDSTVVRMDIYATPPALPFLHHHHHHLPPHTTHFTPQPLPHGQLCADRG
jgi:hypothetical protein